MKLRNKFLILALVVTVPIIVGTISISTIKATTKNAIKHKPNFSGCCCPGCLKGTSVKTITITNDNLKLEY
ncbi:hypothetical protein [Mycoplasma sp. VS31B]